MAPTSRRPRALVELGAEEEAAARLGRERPIVVARAAAGRGRGAAVAPRSADLGVMLPYTPLHHLLLADAGAPLVMTSGNVSDEPIAYRDDDALRAAGRDRRPLPAPRPPDRDPHRRLGRARSARRARRPLLLRRSRGYVPASLALPRPAPRAAPRAAAPS